MTKNLLLSLLLIVPTVVSALPTDRNKPIEIESNTADIDNNKGVSVYKGDVVMTQGTTRITGDKVTVYSINNEVNRIVAEGDKQRAYYQEEQANKKGLLQAWGHTIDYGIKGDKVHLLKNAQLKQQGDTFKGERIDYDLKQQTVNAQGSKQKGRVQMVIQPKSDKTQ
ncbi:lipopolysaccharide transport periplasmic protein LptA [Endozoicomonas sp. OPT23]|uniref:lipopolysaccharide transport periplasmic protein LptA n=1 Tax=Endozoicomonas sp. OPT23 TaxID=2072845 RepID=UPI00129BEFD1|nr:lipopolysaccharide transport periplasmic protein LptA [Endozoicomonas sp. OPT23]